MIFGIISGCNKDYEWLLPWWWENYKKHNSYPVAIFDFGMSEEGKKFCRDKGIYYELPSINENTIPLTSIDEKDQKLFKFMYGDNRAENSRSSWFKKPQAAYFTPFDVTVWIDLDCEIGLNLNELSYFLDSNEEISLRHELDPAIFFLVLTQYNHIDETTYNSGVIVFKKNCSVIKDWLALSIKDNSTFAGDQEALSRVIYLKNHHVKLLPEKFNSFEFIHEMPSKEIRHFAGYSGKEKIKEMMKLNPNYI